MIYQQEKLKLTARNPYYEALQVYPHGLEQHPHFHTSSSFFVLSVKQSFSHMLNSDCK